MTHMQLQWTAAKPTLPLNGLNICDSTEVSYFYDRECCDAVDRSLLPCPNAISIFSSKRPRPSTAASHGPSTDTSCPSSSPPHCF